jgi:hypothetical protein
MPNHEAVTPGGGALLALLVARDGRIARMQTTGGRGDRLAQLLDIAIRHLPGSGALVLGDPRVLDEMKDALDHDAALSRATNGHAPADADVDAVLIRAVGRAAEARAPGRDLAIALRRPSLIAALDDDGRGPAIAQYRRQAQQVAVLALPGIERHDGEPRWAGDEVLRLGGTSPLFEPLLGANVLMQIAIRHHRWAILPARSVPGDDAFRALGFELRPPFDLDPLFRAARLPAGWRLVLGEAAPLMLEILDEQGEMRAVATYDVTPPERRAALHLAP